MIEEPGWPYVKVAGWDINMYWVLILAIVGYAIGVYMKQPIAGAAIGVCAGAVAGAVHFK